MSVHILVVWSLWWRMGGPTAGGGFVCCATFHGASTGVTVQSVEMVNRMFYRLHACTPASSSWLLARVGAGW